MKTICPCIGQAGTTDQVLRRSTAACSATEGAFESKTPDFDALSVGQRGAKTPGAARAASEAREPTWRRGYPAPGPQGRGERESVPASLARWGEIRSATGKEVSKTSAPRTRGGSGFLSACPRSFQPRRLWPLAQLSRSFCWGGDGGLGGCRVHRDLPA